MRTRHGPSNNAILNNTALAVIFHRGRTNVAAAVQDFAMGPQSSYPGAHRTRLIVQLDATAPELSPTGGRRAALPPRLLPTR